MNVLPTFASRGELAPLLNKIHHCEALELLRRLPDKSVDVLITDLPYGVSKNNAEWDATIPLHWVSEAWRVTDRMLVMTGNSGMIEVANALGNYKDCLAMYATNGMTRSKISFGNWFPVLAVGNWKWEGRPNVITYTVDSGETIDHPSPKPLLSMEKLLYWYTKENEVIVDPFCGSGTTAIAARNLNRRFICGDLYEPYVNTARIRLMNSDPFQSTLFKTGEKQLSLFSA